MGRVKVVASCTLDFFFNMTGNQKYRNRVCALPMQEPIVYNTSQDAIHHSMTRAEVQERTKKGRTKARHAVDRATLT